VATLYREGPELDSILAELDDEYPGQVHVSDVVYRRDSGVLGFFAHRRVGVHYTLDDVEQAGFGAVLMTADENPIEAAASGDPLDQLLVMAERAELAHRRAQLAAEVVESGRPVDVGPEDESTNVEFARMLLELAAQKASERRSREATELPELAELVERSEPAEAPQLPTTRMPSAVPQPPPAASPPAASPPAASPPAASPPAASPPAVPPSLPLFAPVTSPLPAPTSGPAPLPPVFAPPLAPVLSPPVVAPAPPDRADEPAWSGLRRPIGAHRVSETVEDESSSFAAVPTADSTNPLVLRRRLVELGVPVEWIPDGSGDPYWVTGQLVNRLPAPPALVLEPGEALCVPLGTSRPDCE
jgi:hypothetical protein